MQLCNRIAILLAIVFLAFPVIADDAESEIKRTLNFLADEWTAGDLDSIGGHFHRDFVLITKDGIHNRAERLRELGDIMTSGQDHGELSYSDLKVKSLSDEYVMVWGKSQLKFADKTELNNIFSSVYVKTPFGWRVVFTHE